MKFGSIIMSAFAAVWWIVGTWAAGHGSPTLYCIPLLVSAAIVVATIRDKTPEAAESAEEQRRVGRLVGIASGLEGLLIVVACNILANVHASDFYAPVIAIIVGLHFVPLALWLPNRAQFASAALLVALGAIGFWIHAVDERILCVSIGAACVLWLTCTQRLFAARATRNS